MVGPPRTARYAPAADIIPPKVNKQEPRYLSEPEYRRLLRACSHRARDTAIAELFLQTGIALLGTPLPVPDRPQTPQAHHPRH